MARWGKILGLTLMVLGSWNVAQAAVTPRAAPNAINMSIGGEQDARVSRILPDYNLNYNDAQGRQG